MVDDHQDEVPADTLRALRTNGRANMRAVVWHGVEGWGTVELEAVAR